MKRAVSEDSEDFYNRRLAWLLLPLAVAWLVWTFGVRSALPSHSDDLVSVSRDAGLRMTLKQPFPPWLLWAHSISGALLLAGAMLQKRLVSQMARGEGGGDWHRRTGYALAALMLVMSGAGFLMSPYSTWNNFTAFSVAFAAPWVGWAAAIVVSGRRRKVRMRVREDKKNEELCCANSAQYGFHRLMGNQMLKGCLAVPAARLAGAVVQDWAPAWGEDAGYYVGIFGVVCVVAVWEACDVAAYLMQPCSAATVRQRGKQQ